MLGHVVSQIYFELFPFVDVTVRVKMVELYYHFVFLLPKKEQVLIADLCAGTSQYLVIAEYVESFELKFARSLVK